MFIRKSVIEKEPTYTPVTKTKKSKWDIDSKTLEAKMNDYLANGGTVTQLEPESDHEMNLIIEKSAISQTVTKNLRPI